MNDEWKNVEGLLGAMPLRKPPAELDERVLSGTAPRRWGTARLLVPAVAAAVLALVAAWVWLKQPPGAERKGPPGVATAVAKTEGAQPEASAPVVITWSETSYEGTVLLGDETPAYAFVRHGVRLTNWVDAGTGARFVTRVPMKNVILIKAQVD